MAQLHHPERAFRLLYIEDNPGDVRLVETALQECDFSVELQSVDDGQKGIDFLQQRGDYIDAKRPELILLDLNLPKKGGEEVLVEIKKDSNLKGIPVIVFTSAASSVVCMPIYQEYANTCIRKPSDLDSFFKTVKQTCEYWFHVACLPRH